MKTTFAPVLLFALLLSMAATVRADLVGYWKLDETGGTNAYATVGPNGVLHGSAWFVPGGISGNALYVDETTNGYVDCGTNFLFPASFSVQVWVKTNPGDTGSLIPVARHLPGYLDGYFLAINNVGDGESGDPTGKAHFYVSRPATGVSQTVVNNGRWHQLVGVWDNLNEQASLFVDGTLQASGCSPGVISNSVPLVIGGVGSGPDGEQQSGYRGLLDEVRLYDNALSAADVLALYQNTPTPTLTITNLAGQIQLGWNSVTNKNYQVQYSSDLTNPAGWSNLGALIPGNDGNTYATNNLSTPFVFTGWSRPCRRDASQVRQARPDSISPR